MAMAMESASSSTCCSLFHGRLSNSISRPLCSGTVNPLLRRRPASTLNRYSSPAPALFSNPSSKRLSPVSPAARPFAAFNSASDEHETARLAVLLEVEGVLMDAYRMGNRLAFNKAFQTLGLDCANWAEPVYLDLSRKSAGDEEMMLMLYFNRIGWPTSLPTSEKSAFVKSVLQKKKGAMDELMMSKEIPLRPGVEEFIDNAYKEGIPVVILTSYSRSGENVARAVIEMLGEDRLSKIKIVGTAEVEQSLYGQLVLGGRLPSGVDEELVKEVRKAAAAEKQRIAEAVASMLKLSVELDTTSSESLQKIVAALRAGAEFAEVPMDRCVLVAGSQLGVAGAQQIGMPCVVLRSSLTSRAEFPSAKAILDGFGGADLTISRLQRIL